MYTTFFGFRELPFSHTNDLRFYYPTSAARNIEKRIKTALREHPGLILLTGDPGTGKTALLRRILDSLEDNVCVVSLPFSTARFDDILGYLCEHFAIEPHGSDSFTKVLAIQEHLRRLAEEGITTVLCVDEAQNLLKETLDRLRLLLHLRGPAGKLLRILLVGQPEIETKLAHPDLCHLQQYVTVHCRLDPLSPEAVRSFIQHRLRVAGCERPDLFSPESIERITHYSQAVPQLINVLCDNSLLTAYMEQSHTVTRAFVEEVAENLQLTSIDPLSSDTQDQTTAGEVQFSVLLRPPPKKESSSPQSRVYNFAWAGVGVFCAWLSSGSPISMNLPFFAPSASTATLSPALVGTSALIANLPQPLQQPATPQLTDGQISEVLQDQHRLFPTSPHLTQEKKEPAESRSSRVSAAQYQGAFSTQSDRSNPIREKQTPSSMSPVVLPTASTEAPFSMPSQKNHNQMYSTKLQEVPHLKTTKAKSINLPFGMVSPQEALPRTTMAGNERNVERPHSRINAQDKRGWTALMIAARDNRPDVVRKLLAAGATVNLVNKEGETALMHAADNNHLAVVQILLEHGAAIDKKSKLGWTALMYAAAKGHRHTVEALLSKGANPKVRDNDGKTASAYAMRQGTVPSLTEQLRRSPSFRTRFSRVDAEKPEWLKRHEYREIALLLRQAEMK